MREFMTKVSDYWNERKNDPDRKENRLAVAVTVGVAVVVLVLLAVLLWGYGARERRQMAQEQELEAAQTGQEAQGTQEETAETVREEAVKYMSEDSGEQLRQEYLTSTAYLREKVEELLETMMQVQEALAEADKERQEGMDAVQTKITILRNEVDAIVEHLKETQVKIADLTEILQVIDKEKIPVIQQQILEIRGDMEQVRTDIDGVRLKIAALEKEDEKLWASIGKLEKKLQTALDQNVSEVNDRLDQLQSGIDHLDRELKEILKESVTDVNQRVDVLAGQMEERIERMSALIGQLEEQIAKLRAGALSYEYEAESNTLYLMPMQQEGGQ